MRTVVNGHEILFDPEDAELVERGNLHVRAGGRNRPTRPYVYWRAGGSRKPEFSLARLILGLAHRDRSLLADHINRNTLDNRRANLRAVTPATNVKNRSGYIRDGYFAKKVG